ncbi:CmcI family methyltransferase [Neptunomonas marina]|uniref:Rhamnosyl O-methyltransferase n=1 Tax=Neptunomonas marina TaxID=1815562 RepID=A0A437Q6Z6_9GAMM|nr:CmcI family methyltransferase [Neptunomonas marina]RVU30302.1 rhamnosyl O-methyltransferase [Neptunomonas marina]
MNKEAEAYHQWYYNSEVWHDVKYMGVPCYKSVADMWNYQEVLAELKPALIVEFGTRFGGSALFFSVTGRAINPDLKVVSVDISHEDVFPEVLLDSAIQLVTGSSSDPQIALRIEKMRALYPGPVFFILDSDHSKSHVLAELELLRRVTKSGDYVVVEDSNINGHPVLPGWGEGPYEAIQEYMAQYPDDYVTDSAREQKFGFTFAPSGFLIKR